MWRERLYRRGLLRNHPVPRHQILERLLAQREVVNSEKAAASSELHEVGFLCGQRCGGHVVIVLAFYEACTQEIQAIRELQEQTLKTVFTTCEPHLNAKCLANQRAWPIAFNRERTSPVPMHNWCALRVSCVHAHHVCPCISRVNHVFVRLQHWFGSRPTVVTRKLVIMGEKNRGQKTARIATSTF